MSEFAAAAAQWQREGWVLVEGLVPEADIDAVADDLERLYGGDTFDNYNGMRDSATDRPRASSSAARSSTACAGFRSVAAAR